MCVNKNEYCYLLEIYTTNFIARFLQIDTAVGLFKQKI
jgi:hypothetical protein